jgi:hypothetical protein
MKDTKKNEANKGVTRRGFLKVLLPGMFAAGVLGTTQTSQAPAPGSYGNGPYGGVAPKRDV